MRVQAYCIFFHSVSVKCNPLLKVQTIPVIIYFYCKLQFIYLILGYSCYVLSTILIQKSVYHFNSLRMILQAFLKDHNNSREGCLIQKKQIYYGPYFKMWQITKKKTVSILSMPITLLWITSCHTQQHGVCKTY